MKPYKTLAMICAAFFAINLIAVIGRVSVPFQPGDTFGLIWFLVNCAGVVLFAVLTVKFSIESVPRALSSVDFKPDVG